jgi:hyperosmotically inducible periplasmic protein
MKKQVVPMLLASSLAVLPAILMTGCCAGTARQSSWRYQTDRGVEAQIKAGVEGDPAVSGTDVTVTSIKGRVQMTGYVPNEAAKERAWQIAAGIPGVRALSSGLVVPAEVPTGR